MLTETEKVDRLLSNDTEFYLRSIDGPGIDAAAAPFRAQIQSLGAKLAQEAGAAQVIVVQVLVDAVRLVAAIHHPFGEWNTHVSKSDDAHDAGR